MIMIAKRSGMPTLAGRRRKVRKGVTTADSSHPIVRDHPHLWQEIVPDYPAPAEEPDRIDVSTIDQRPGTETVPDRPSNAEIRQWAAHAGRDGPAYGKIPTSVLDAWRETHGVAG